MRDRVILNALNEHNYSQMEVARHLELHYSASVSTESKIKTYPESLPPGYFSETLDIVTGSTNTVYRGVPWAS